MKEITLNGKTYTLAFNLAAEMAYEDMAGHALDPASLFASPKAGELAHILAATIIGSDQNPQFDINADLLYNPNREEVTAAINEALAVMLEWLRIPAQAEAHVPADEEPAEHTEESESPNS